MHRRDPAAVVVATRRQRSEGPVFDAMYRMYKGLFRVLTGQQITFGNFSLIPAAALRRLVYTASVWNNLPASVRRSRFRILSLDTVRGRRYAGQSSTNIVSLVVHGLSSVSVYSDIAFVRLLMLVVALVGLTILGIALALGLRLWTEIPTPGWTTTVVGWASVVLLQALLLCGGAVFLLLSQRSSATVVPALIADDFIAERTTLVPPRRTASADGLS
jgi:hypothetical protein